MRKTKVLMALGVAVFCVATTAQSKPVHENVTDSHKKNNAIPERKITEKDIAECTSLINKAEQQKVAVPLPHAEIPVVSNNTKIDEQSYKPANVQLFASDDPKAIAHLTGKTTELVAAHPPVIKPIPTTIQSKPADYLTPPATKPMAKLTVPAIPDTVNQPIKQVGRLKTVTVSTSKPIQHPKTQSIAKPPVPTVIKPAVIKKIPVAPSRSTIKLSAPTNNVPDMNHLQGKSAKLENIRQSAPSKSSVTEKNNTKLINKKKQSIFSTPRAEAKK